MSIPVSIDPLGTLGAAREVDFVQPVMTGPSSWVTPLADGSCGMTVTSSDSTLNWVTLNRNAYIFEKGVMTVELQIHFDKPVKVTEVEDSARITLDSKSRLTVLRDGEQVGISGIYSHPNVGKAVIETPEFSQDYTLRIELILGWLSLGKINIKGKIRI